MRRPAHPARKERVARVRIIIVAVLLRILLLLQLIISVARLEALAVAQAGARARKQLACLGDLATKYVPDAVAINELPQMCLALQWKGVDETQSVFGA